MNIQAQICGIALMLILLYYFFQRRRLLIRTDVAFLRTLVLAIVCVSLDALSIVAIAHISSWPYALIIVNCKAYLCSLVLVSLSVFLYALVESRPKENTMRSGTMILFYGIALAGCILISVLPIHIHNTNTATDVYTYGPSVISTYIFAIFFVAATFYLIFRKKGQMNPLRRKAILFWMLLWMIAAGVQFLNNELLVIGYAMSLGMMILYTKLENPEFYMDRKTGLYNSSYLQLLLNELYVKQENRSILDVILLPVIYKEGTTAISPEVISEICHYLDSIPDISVFEYADDELIIVSNSAEDTVKTHGKIRARLSQGFGYHGSVQVSAHYAVIPDLLRLENTKSFFDLLHYIRKNIHREADTESCIVDDNFLTAMLDEKRLEEILINAVKYDQLEVFYQPIYSTWDGSFTSAEALVRIREEDGSVLPPGLFIPLAETNGMILRIGEIVFEKVCIFLKKHPPEELGLHYIEVNLSVVQCGYEHLADDYISIMEQYAIDPGWINLEITESASLATKKTLLENMHKLIEYGVKFSLDDFGTGQSNLNYIIDMPVEIVKFDREMTSAYFANGKARYVMEAAMQMIRGLQLAIVSEGIEDQDQFDAMADLDIAYIQGFFFSKPLPENEFVEFLKNRNTIE